MLRFALFLTTFLSLYFAGNFYIFWRLAYLFSIRRNQFFYILVIIFAISYLVTTILETAFANILTRILYVIAATWMGIGLLLLSSLLVYELVNLFFSPPKLIAGSVIIALTAVVTIYAIANAQMLHVTTINIHAPVDMNIVQLSDIHLGSVRADFLHRVVKKTNALNPDLVLITGDLLDPHGKLKPNTLNPLNQLNAPVFFVTGNHERYLGVEKAMELLKTIKVKPLRNQTVDFNSIQIVGIDDSSNKNYLNGQLRTLKIDPSKFSILMYHRPKELKAAADAGIDLVLSGHTHNGQIFPFNFVVRFFFRHLKGLFVYENCSLHVSSGTGTWGPRMRLGSKSEVVLIKLVKHNDVDSKAILVSSK